MEESLELEKRQQLRNNEYYTMQHIFDNLYEKSLKGNKFNKLMSHITNPNNIKLAFRNIKKNKGSKTVGTDNLNIDIFKNVNNLEFVNRIQNKLIDYHPKSVRRVEIPKQNGKTRPLGIPCIEDRIIQQCIKQVIEPICEAKFHNHSYGFRPNRSTKHAIARCMSLMNRNKLHYVVDVDIKGFFDNVNHSKLKKQLWNIGIQDKNLISILGKILKSEIQGIGTPNKGTPQGGIISPLLANVVLNELDWWLSSQWLTFETKKNYTTIRNNSIDNTHKYRILKKTKLKEMFAVRYADDFKIFCKDYKTAQKVFKATKMWLKERLGLEISPEKSKITNLRKNYTEFLGIKLKVRPKKKTYVCKSNMCDKAINKCVNELKVQIKKIQRHNNAQEVMKLNAMILGMHIYYNCATNVAQNFKRIEFLVKTALDNRLRINMSSKPRLTETYKKFYGRYKGKYRTIHGITIFPIYGVRLKPSICFSQNICNYTKQGRSEIHKDLNSHTFMMILNLLNRGNKYSSTEVFDNSISKIAGQQGCCFVTKETLEIGCMECHHKKPRALGGSDNYNNLMWLCTDAHKLVHATTEETIKKYVEILKLDESGYKRLNTLRKLVGNSVI